MSYLINPDRNVPWNGLPGLPIDSEICRTIEIFEQLAKSRGALGRLQGRSIAIPDQGMLVNTISLQEAKASSAIENILTTDDELYKAYSEQRSEQLDGAAKEVLRYREALLAGHVYLKKTTHSIGIISFLSISRLNKLTTVYDHRYHGLPLNRAAQDQMQGKLYIHLHVDQMLLKRNWII